MKRRNPGFVLVCVLWVVVMLTLLTLGFGRRATLDRRAAAYALDHSQAMYTARAAVQRGIVEVRNKLFLDALRNAEMSYEGHTDLSEIGVAHLGQPWAQPQDLYNLGNLIKKPEGFENDSAYFYIEDGDRYIDINRAPGDLLNGVKALNRSVSRRISTRRSQGEYDDEGPTSFHALEELRYMNGMTDSAWFGDRRRTGVKYILTVDGDQLVNVNTAPREVLESIPGLAPAVIETILAYRAGGDGEIGTGDDRGFRTIDELSYYVDPRGDAHVVLQKFCKVNSSAYKITGIATRRNGTVRAVCSALVRVYRNNAVMVSWQEETLGS